MLDNINRMSLFFLDSLPGETKAKENKEKGNKNEVDILHQIQVALQMYAAMPKENRWYSYAKQIT